MSSSQHPLYPAIKFLTVTATKLYYGFLLAYLKLAPPKLPLPSSNTTGTTTTKAEDYHKYGFATLRAYDLALSWNCFLYGVSKTEMQQWFDQGLTEVHADIGPGSGYYVSTRTDIESARNVKTHKAQYSSSSPADTLQTPGLPDCFV